MKKLVAAPQYTELLIKRLVEQLIEDHGMFESTLLIGLQPKGKFLLNQILKYLEEYYGYTPTSGLLDATFFRDDFRKKELAGKVHNTDIHFLVEERNVVLVDDVLFTGRSVRSAFDALISFGRPAKVQLLVLVDRLFKREFPINPDYSGLKVNTLSTERVKIDWETNELNIWITKED